MVERLFVFTFALLSGCALIDAATGDGDGDGDVPVIDTNNTTTANNGTTGTTVGVNNSSNVNNTPDFVPTECGWAPCFCGQTGCEPATDCQTVGCRTCLTDAHCNPGDVCLPSGFCGGCQGATFSASDTYVGPSGTSYVCEYDPNVPQPICLLSACL